MDRAGAANLSLFFAMWTVASWALVVVGRRTDPNNMTRRQRYWFEKARPVWVNLLAAVASTTALTVTLIVWASLPN